jgi:CheY-like chemotaxis protein
VAIVEDDDAIRVVIEDLLEGEGYVCLSGSSLESGLDLLERQRPDLLILDIVLGGVASGWMLLDQLGRNPYTAGIPVIVCTADAGALASHEAVLRERGIRCLAKPFDVRDLLRSVEQALTRVKLVKRSQWASAS